MTQGLLKMEEAYLRIYTVNSSTVVVGREPFTIYE